MPAPIAKYALGPACSLHLAVASGRDDVVSALLEHPTISSDLDLELVSEGVSALMRATHLGHDSIARALLAAGAKCDVHSAAALGVEQVVRDAPADSVEAIDPFGRTPLLVAATGGDAPTVSALLERGASIHAVDGFRNSPLHAACIAGHVDVAKRLLSAAREAPYALVRTTNADGETSMLLACKHGWSELVAELLRAAESAADGPDGAAGALANVCDTRGACPLLLAVAGGHEGVATTLLEHAHGLQLDLTDRFGCAAVSVAAAQGSPLLDALIARKADVNTADNALETPLMAATMHGHEESVSALLQADGIDVRRQGLPSRRPSTNPARPSLRATPVLPLCTKL